MLNFAGIKALIFDLDGLIADTEYYHNLSIIKIMKEYGVKLNKSYLYKLVGVSTKENFLLLEKDFNIKVDMDSVLRYREKVYLDIIKHSGIKAFPGFKELINIGKAYGLLLAVGSSSPGPQVSTVLTILTRSVGIKEKPEALFDAIVTGSDVEKVKPFADIYRKTAKELKLRPSQCLVLEDSVAGVTAAKRAKMLCIAVKSRYSKQQDLSRADLTAGSLRGVLKILKRNEKFLKLEEK